MNAKVSYRDQIQLILLSILPAALVSGPLISELIINVILIFSAMIYITITNL